MLRRPNTIAMAVITLGAVLLASPFAVADQLGFEQTFAVEEGASLEIEAHSGEILIEVWDRDEIEVQAEHGPRVRVEAREMGGDLVLRGFGKEIESAPIDFDIRIPAGVNIRVRGHYTDVEIEGTEAEVDVEVVDGDIYLQGGRGEVYLQSVHGSIEVEGAEGIIDLESTNENVTVSDCQGEIYVETINGDLRLSSVTSKQVEGTTVTGDIRYDGTLDADGDYYFTTHSGDIQVTLAESADLTVTVTTFRGEFQTDLTVEPVQKQKGKRYELVLGAGTGQLRVESFLGDIELFSPKRGRTKRSR